MAATIQEVWCESDTGTGVINLQRDDGPPTNILSANLTCGTGGTSTTSFVSGENSLSAGHNMDFQIVSGTAKRINVSIKYQ